MSMVRAQDSAENSAQGMGGPFDEVWQRWWSTGDRDALNTLTVLYSPQVRYIATRLAAHVPRSVDVEDLIQEGILGLRDAIQRFDPKRKIPFESYAAHRIRGAMTDFLRQLDWHPRRVRDKERAIERAQMLLRQELGREPTKVELANAIGVDLDGFDAWLASAAGPRLVSLQEPQSNGDSLFAAEDRISDDRDLPEENTESSALHRDVRAAIRALPDPERTVIALYFLETLDLTEIGQILGVTNTRVCQIKASALAQLRKRLSGWFPEGTEDEMGEMENEENTKPFIIGRQVWPCCGRRWTIHLWPDETLVRKCPSCRRKWKVWLVPALMASRLGGNAWKLHFVEEPERR